MKKRRHIQQYFEHPSLNTVGSVADSGEAAQQAGTARCSWRRDMLTTWDKNKVLIALQAK